MVEGGDSGQDELVLDEVAVAATARRLLRGLVRVGLSTGDALAVLCGNTLAFVAARDAATALGLYVVPLNPRLAAPEVTDLVTRSGARAIVVTDELAPLAAGVTVPRVVGLADLPAGPDDRTPLGPATLPDAAGATILFTSGTTGRPKACVRPASADAARITELTATYGITAADVHLIACPLAHSAPGIFLRAARLAGARTVLLRKFDARGFLQAVGRHRASLFFLVPTQVERLLALPDDVRAAADLSSVRACVVAGAPFPAGTKRRFLAWLGPGKLWEFYGSSETGTVTVLPPAAHEAAPPGGVGWPVAGVALRLRAADGTEVAPGELGEVHVRAASNLHGYLGEGDAPAWVTVGDLGRLAPDGSLVLVDRKHDLIITGGVNVYPAEVERALLEHPDVAGAVVCGLPHADWGEQVAALVAPRAGATLTGADLHDFLHARIAGYKVPKRWKFVAHDELPIGPSGKPLRRSAARLF